MIVEKTSWKCNLVDIADDNRGEEDLGEGDGHGVDGGHHRGVHEVDGVAVEEDGGAAHCHADYHRPEYVLEAWANQYFRIIPDSILIWRV